MSTIKDNTIDLIYCDILYGTGRKFKDYQDLKPKREVIEEHYIPRIKEMKRVLKDTGSIYLQMDTKINHWLRCIMDDIFGYENFQNEIVWSYRSGGNTKKAFQKKHDLILYFSKSKKVTFNQQYEKSYTPTMKGRKRFTEIGGVIGICEHCDSKDAHYRNVPMRDVFTVPFLSTQNKERVGYETQKPKALLERIIKASSNEGDLVADFYAGSHTTGEVALELGRHYIGCDINPKSLEIGNKRLQRFL